MHGWTFFIMKSNTIILAFSFGFLDFAYVDRRLGATFLIL